jgi:hypothetical protein
MNAIDWMFQINGYDKDIVMKDCDESNGEGRHLAEIRTEVDYQKVTVTIWPLFKTFSLEAQRKILLHELCHVINADSRRAKIESLDGKLTHEQRCKEINEEATSKIENILDRLLTGNLKYAKKAYEDYLK